MKKKNGKNQKYEFNPLGKGWLKFLLLRLLYEKPKHGYLLAHELKHRGLVNSEQLSVGSVYILLKRMEKYGLLTSKKETVEGRERRVYKITEHGKEYLKQGLEAVFQRKKAMEDLTTFYDQTFEKISNSSTPEQE